VDFGNAPRSLNIVSLFFSLSEKALANPPESKRLSAEVAVVFSATAEVGDVPSHTNNTR